MFVGYNKKLALKYVKEQFEKEGYILLSTEYINNSEKLNYICPKGHRHSITWKDFHRGYRCPHCKGITKKTIEEVRESFEREGYTLLTEIYLNNRQKLDYICPKGHRHQIAWSHWNEGNRCFYCCNTVKKTFEKVKNSFEEEGYTLLAKEYINAHQKLDYICPKGHKHFISWSKWHNGTRCLYCGGRARKEIKKIRESFHKEGYKLLTTEYKNCDQKLKYICPKGHKHQISWDKWKSGRRCLTCGKEKTGQINKLLMLQKWSNPIFQQKMHCALSLKPNKPETALLNFLQHLFPNEYKYVGDFQFFLGGKNPNFMNCNSQKKLIECFGEFWHSSRITGLSKKEHEEERVAHFKKFGFDTLVIWENELKNQQVLVPKLQAFHSKPHQELP